MAAKELIGAAFRADCVSVETDRPSWHICGMDKPEKKPEMRPRELKDGSGWYVLVQWRDRPSQQVGGFRSEEEAQQWIIENSAEWLRVRFEDTPFARL